jgi:hypothetical protein
MAKYDPLHRFLRRARSSDSVLLTFADIERIIGAFLPKASRDPLWWSNSPGADRASIQVRSWLEAGFHARPGRDETVVFVRMDRAEAAQSPQATVET